MASRLKSGRFIGAATSESARRQLMQPVPCWEKAWIVPESATPGSTLKVLRWVKTDKKQQFSDDEDAADEPLAPLPDEPIPDEDDDEDKDQDDNADSGVVPSRDVSEPITARPSIAPEDSEIEPKPHPLSMSLLPDSETATNEDIVDDGTLDSSLNPSLVVPASLRGVGVAEQLHGTIDGIDIRQFGAVEAFDPNAVEDQVMQDALQNGMPGMLGK